ncbi:MAG: phage portal protein [Deltaproteobacteria bacterium]|nr:phage portal protein [Deltaproteobacteria bacterium]
MTEPCLNILDGYGRKIPITTAVALYEGAATGRRMNTWGTSTAGPTSSVFSSLNTLRSRTRELIRNNPLVDGGVDSYVANIIGSGICPRWQFENPELKAALQQLWDDWVDESDFNGQLNFYGQQSLICRGLIDAGESITRFVPRPSNIGLAVPLQIQLLEADHLDESYNTIAPNGNEVRFGKEIDADGRCVAYWLFREHPGEHFLMNRNFGDRIRVPAYDAADAKGGGIVHVFKPVRAGQMRGRPWLASIIVRLREIDLYTDAELVRKKTAALFGGFITETNITGDPSLYFGKKDSDDSEGRDVIALEPGTFPVLPRGMDVKFSQPADVGQTYEVWIKQQLRDIARGAGWTYEQLTGDLSGVNYSSIRVGLLEFRRRVEQLQREILAFQFCRVVSHVWLDAVVLNNILPLPGYFQNRRVYRRIKWRPDGWPWVDPVKDQLAEQMAVRNGFKSRAQVIAERGGDIETVDREIAEDNERADQNGLIYDSDPRHTAKSGAIQKATDSALTDSLFPKEGD